MSTIEKDTNVENTMLSKILTTSAWMAGSVAVLMMIITVSQVLLRYIFRSPLTWTDQISGYFLVILVYVASPWMAFVDGHIRIDVLYRTFKGNVKNVFDIIILLFIITYGAVMTWQTTIMSIDSFTMNILSSADLRVPLFPFQGLVAIAAFFTTVIYFISLINTIKMIRSKRSEEKKHLVSL